MKQLTILILLTIVSIGATCQIITFTDFELKSFLINEACVDTTGTDWQGQIDVDVNNDNEIQMSEALSVQHLLIQDFSNSYSIQLLDDLAEFKNLVSLSVRVPILEFDQIQLDSLKALYIIDIGTITKIDISNLPNLTDAIQIEGITTLDTLNIKNGSSASLFSLFYTQDIKFACVDSIAAEYNAFGVFAALAQDGVLSIDCSTVGITEELNGNSWFDVFPNPTNGLIELKANNEIEELYILNVIGETVFQTKNVNNSLDISSLHSGVYFLKVRFDDKYMLKKIILN